MTKKEMKKFKAAQKTTTSNGITRTELPGATYVRWNNDYCLRMIGYDAFEHFGLTHDEADFMTSYGDWTCLKRKDGKRCASDGYEQGDSDIEFVLSTASDVQSVVLMCHQDKAKKYTDLLVKMLKADKATREKCFNWSKGMSDDDFITARQEHIDGEIKKYIA